MDKRSTIFLPVIGTGETSARALYTLLKAHPDQKHPRLIWDDCLENAALLRCSQMAVEWSHCYQGDCVNRIVRRTCYLPLSYPENGNSIESAVGGAMNPITALKHLLLSEKHSDHLLGRNPFFVVQDRIGIGFQQVLGSEYQYYYVILISF